MHRKLLKGLLCCLIYVPFLSQNVGAEGVAGEFLKKDENKMSPHAEFEPSHNITDIAPAAKEDDEDVEFSADSLESNSKENTITASGNVEILYNGLTLNADKVVYYQEDDRIVASGNVKLTEQSGNVVYAENVELSEHMSRASMKKVSVEMIDGTKIFADSFRKRANDDKVIEHTMYTPCDFCNGIAPLWSINARKVKHDASSQNVNYNDAVLWVKKVPVLYTPYLSHPDPSVKRRSGFLAPTIGSTKYLGASLEVPYFLNISDNQSLTLKPIFSTDKNIVAAADYSTYFYSGKLDVSGSYLRDDADDRKDNRGNIFAKWRYELSDFWVASSNINYVSDDLYLKELSLQQKDDAWLVSNMKLEGFENRDYAAIEGYYYKLISYNLRVNDYNEYLYDNTKPYVLPLMSYENISNPSSIGSYFKNSFGFASIYREDDMSTQRMSMINSWVLPYTSRFGEKYKLTASVKSDVYYVNSYRSSYNYDYTGTATRVFPQIGLEWKYPFVRSGENFHQIIEPVVVAVFAPNSGNQEKKIPNEDSQDVDLYDTNILDLDRYPGYDRNDTGSRVSYGFNWSAYDNYWGRTSAFIAQSYRLNREESFTSRMGDTGRFTDYVGRVYASPNDYINLDYRFRLDRDNLAAKYSELGASIGTDIFKVYTSYIYLKNNRHYSEDVRERRELYNSISSALTRDWTISVYNRQDLTKGGGSLEHGGSLIYEDECLKFIIKASKSTTSDPDLDNGYSFGFTFYLKTLGGFGT